MIGNVANEKQGTQMVCPVVACVISCPGASMRLQDAQKMGCAAIGVSGMLCFVSIVVSPSSVRRAGVVVLPGAFLFLAILTRRAVVGTDHLTGDQVGTPPGRPFPRVSLKRLFQQRLPFRVGHFAGDLSHMLHPSLCHMECTGYAHSLSTPIPHACVHDNRVVGYAGNVAYEQRDNRLSDRMKGASRMVVAVAPRMYMTSDQRWVIGTGDSDEEVIGRVLRALLAVREAKLGRKISSSEMIEALGVGQTVWSRWVRGESPPSDENRRALERYFGLEPLSLDQAILDARATLLRANLTPGDLPAPAASIPARPELVRLVGPLVNVDDEVLETISDEAWQKFLQNATRLGKGGRRMADATLEDLDATDDHSKTG